MKTVQQEELIWQGLFEILLEKERQLAMGANRMEIEKELKKARKKSKERAGETRNETIEKKATRLDKHYRIVCIYLERKLSLTFCKGDIRGFSNHELQGIIRMINRYILFPVPFCFVAGLVVVLLSVPAAPFFVLWLLSPNNPSFLGLTILLSAAHFFTFSLLV